MHQPLPDMLVRLAGFLAERGVPEIVLITGGEERSVRTRETDLPGELMSELTRQRASAAAQGVTLRAASLGLEIVLRAGDSHLSWSCADPRLTVELARALAV
ncbi:MAG: hypothetical protein K2Y21_10220 [Phycisphaerales bacterium]|nr:hypothetical protein [Phycisphaerales bacterium]